MIHINIGSNLNSNFGSKIDNITIAINLLIESKLKIKKISNFYETPSYPNKNLPKFANIGLIAKYDFDHIKLIKEVIGILETQHFTKKSYISLKEESLYSYLERLDPNRTIFLASEIERFVKQHQSLRKENQFEELNRAFEIFDLYRKRYEKRYNYQKGILETSKLSWET